MLLEEGSATCKTCGEHKPRSEFYRHTYGKIYGTCKACHIIRCHHTDHSNRIAVLSYYSVGDEIQCECCGETHTAFLSLDHKDGGGNEHRREIGVGGKRMATWIAKNNFPPMFRVLCHNCNFAEGIFGYCPHQRERDAAKAPSVGERPSVGPEAPLDETKAAPEIYT